MSFTLKSNLMCFGVSLKGFHVDYSHKTPELSLRIPYCPCGQVQGHVHVKEFQLTFHPAFCLYNGLSLSPHSKKTLHAIVRGDERGLTLGC